MHQTWIQRMGHLGRLCVCVLLASVSALCLADPPARAGRVADIVGTAWYHDEASNAWSRLLRNQTVAEGDRLRVDPRSRVTVRVGSTSLWLDAGAEAEFAQMDDAGVLLRLDKGALGLALRASDAASEFQVQTREGLLLPDAVGLYRVEQLVRSTRAQALQGRLRFESDRSGAVQRAWLRDGEQAEFLWADGPRTEHQALTKDGFTNWLLSQSGATAMAGTASEEYVSPEMTGMEELDRHGQWEQSAEYGNVWRPTQVAVDWEPYRDGRWVWTRNWGWSWVDDSPWGFAPFHYGRWVVWRGRWCWTPGHYVARPVYAPALVTWRQSPGLTIGVNVRQPPQRGSWSPLPPREVYVPVYRHSGDYRDRMNRPYDGRTGPDVYRPPMGPQRDNRDDKLRGSPRDHSRDTRAWNDSPRDEPRRQGSTVSAPVFTPPPAPSVSPPRPDRTDEPVDRPRGRDRERGRNDRERMPSPERAREASPISAVAQPAPPPAVPAVRPQNQSDAGEREHPRKRFEDKNREKRGADIER